MARPPFPGEAHDLSDRGVSPRPAAVERSLQSALRAVNRRFYDRFASEFDTTRGRPWPGWKRIADRVGRRDNVPAVLDVGCGNGRFGTFLAGRLTGGLSYLGVDGCGALLRAAAEQLGGVLEAPELRRLDLLEADLDRALGDRRFDLVALFGVLHHVPGSDARHRLLRRLGRRLVPAGVLAASIWRFERAPRFTRKIVPWETYNRHRTRRGLEALDLDALEAGDTLLSWGGDTGHPRYCHFPDDAEIESLIAAPRRQLAESFCADGPSGHDNLYLVWHEAAKIPTRSCR